MISDISKASFPNKVGETTIKQRKVWLDISWTRDTDILLVMHGPVAVRVVRPKHSTEVEREGLVVGAETGGTGGRGGRGIDFLRSRRE